MVEFQVADNIAAERMNVDNASGRPIGCRISEKFRERSGILTAATKLREHSVEIACRLGSGPSAGKSKTSE